VGDFSLKRDVAVLSFGSQRFRMRVHAALCVVEVNIEGPDPRAVLSRLTELVDAVIGDCMRALGYVTALSYDCDYFIPLSRVETVMAAGLVLNRRDGGLLLDRDGAVSEFGGWFTGAEAQGSQRDLEAVADSPTATASAAHPEPAFDLGCLNFSESETLDGVSGGSVERIIIVDEKEDRSKVYAIKLFKHTAKEDDVSREIEIMRYGHI